MKSVKPIAIALFVLSGALSDARAGTVMVVDTESFVNAKGGGQATLYVDGRRLRIDSNEGGNLFSLIYRTDGDAPRYWLIDRRTRTYQEMSFQDMKALERRVTEARKIAGKRMERLTPEQRRQMKGIYGNLDALGGVKPAEYKKVASGAKVGRWTCDHYEGYRAGEKREEVWAAGWKTLGIQHEDVAILGDLARLFENIGQEMPAFYAFGRKNTGLDGFPIMVVTYGNGQRREKSEIKDLRSEPIDPQLFELPEGLTKKASGP